MGQRMAVQRCDLLPNPNFLYTSAARTRIAEFVDSALKVLWEKYWGNGPGRQAVDQGRIHIWQLPGLSKLPGSQASGMWPFWLGYQQSQLNSWHARERRDAQNLSPSQLYLRAMFAVQAYDIASVVSASPVSAAQIAGHVGMTVVNPFHAPALAEAISKASQGRFTNTGDAFLNALQTAPRFWDIEQLVREGQLEWAKQHPVYANFYDDVMTDMAAKLADPSLRLRWKDGSLGGLLQHECEWLLPQIYSRFDSPEMRAVMTGEAYGAKPTLTPLKPEEISSLFAAAAANRKAEVEDVDYAAIYVNAPKELLTPFAAQPTGMGRILAFIGAARERVRKFGAVGQEPGGRFLWDIPGLKHLQLNGVPGWDRLLTDPYDLPAHKLTERVRAQHKALGEDPMAAPEQLLLEQRLGIYLLPATPTPALTRPQLLEAMRAQGILLPPETQAQTASWWPSQMNAWANGIGPIYASRISPGGEWEALVNQADPNLAAAVYRELKWEPPTTQQLRDVAAQWQAERSQWRQEHSTPGQIKRVEDFRDRSLAERWSDFVTPGGDLRQDLYEGTETERVAQSVEQAVQSLSDPVGYAVTIGGAGATAFMTWVLLSYTPAKFGTRFTVSALSGLIVWWMLRNWWWPTKPKS